MRSLPPQRGARAIAQGWRTSYAFGTIRQRVPSYWRGTCAYHAPRHPAYRHPNPATGAQLVNGGVANLADAWLQAEAPRPGACNTSPELDAVLASIESQGNAKAAHRTPARDARASVYRA